MSPNPENIAAMTAIQNLIYSNEPGQLVLNSHKIKLSWHPARGMLSVVRTDGTNAACNPFKGDGMQVPVDELLAWAANDPSLFAQPEPEPEPEPQVHPASALAAAKASIDQLIKSGGRVRMPRPQQQRPAPQMVQIPEADLLKAIEEMAPDWANGAEIVFMEDNDSFAPVEEEPPAPVEVAPTCRYFAPNREEMEAHGLEVGPDYDFNGGFHYNRCTNAELNRMGTTECAVPACQNQCTHYEPSKPTVHAIKLVTGPDTEARTYKLESNRYELGERIYRVTVEGKTVHAVRSADHPGSAEDAARHLLDMEVGKVEGAEVEDLPIPPVDNYVPVSFLKDLVHAAEGDQN